MKILVVGASGMLAKPVVKHFDQNGFEIRLFSRSIEKSMYPKEYEMIRGDVFNKSDLDKAITGCDAIHITIGRTSESNAVNSILNLATKKQIKLLSYISGATVSENNRWFSMVDEKYQAEQMIKNSGIPYVIFRPTWFMESLLLMVRNGKASIIGKQNNPYRWIASDDFARLLVNAYKKEEAYNNTFNIYGPESFLFKDALEKYCTAIHPEIKKISTIPTGLMKFIGIISRNEELKMIASMFSYFQKVQEIGNADLTSKLLGKPEITLDKWIKTLKK